MEGFKFHKVLFRSRSECARMLLKSGMERSKIAKIVGITYQTVERIMDKDAIAVSSIRMYLECTQQNDNNYKKLQHSLRQLCETSNDYTKQWL